VLALTGGIASGKSAVSDRLAGLGAAIIDTDVIAREVVEPGQPGLQQVVEAFGKEVLDSEGNLDRRQLRERVFADEHERKRLEGILHPLIELRVRERIAANPDAPMIVLVVPLLVESGLFGDVDGVIVVDVPEALQIERLRQRDGITKAQAERILAAQATRQQRLAVADDVIDNSGSLEALEEQVKTIFLSQRR
jgi:dephospho-CoA kinase